MTVTVFALIQCLAIIAMKSHYVYEVSQCEL